MFQLTQFCVISRSCFDIFNHHRPNNEEESGESEEENEEPESEPVQVDDDQYVPIHLDEKLVHHLEEDFVLINKKNKLLK